MNNPNEQPRIQNSEIENQLLALPAQIAEAERAAATARADLAALEEAASDAELNCLATANIDGKNEEARKTQRRQALADCAEYKAARWAVTQKESEIQQSEINAKQFSRQFAALCAIAELRSAAYHIQSQKANQQLKQAKAF